MAGIKEQKEREPQVGSVAIIFERDEGLAYSLKEVVDTLGAMVDPKNVFSAKAAGDKNAFIAAVSVLEDTPESIIFYGIGGSTEEEINTDRANLEALLTVLGQRKLILIADHMIKHHEEILADKSSMRHLYRIPKPFDIGELEAAIVDDPLPIVGGPVVPIGARRTPPAESTN